MAVTKDLNSDPEINRLQELHDLDILDSEEEQEFTDFVELASSIAGVPISLITLLDETRQWFKAYKGVDFRETSRGIAFCQYAIQQEEPLVVTDATQDDRFRNNPLVTGTTHIRFYAGFPLVTPAGNKLGTLCVLDKKPATLPGEKIELLGKLANKVVRILELRRMNRVLAAMRQEAEAKRDMMDQLLSNQRKMMSILAHDTKGPLTSMAHLVDMISRTHPLEEDMKQMALDLISGQLNVTLDLIDNLIAWGGTHLSAQAYEETPYAAAVVANEAFAPFRRMAGEKGISFSVKAQPDTQFLVNREVLRFMVRNLLHNALKFTENGTITLYLEAAGNCSLIRVEDTGIGMPEGTREKLFVRKVPSRDGTRKEPGSGLGLILVNDFVLKLGGTIRVESCEGKGTTFSISIPQKPLAVC